MSFTLINCHACHLENASDNFECVYCGVLLQIENAKFYNCPRCNLGIVLTDGDVNCGIFVCGLPPSENPHMTSPNDVERIRTLMREGRIHGCGGQMEYDKVADKLVACENK